jgi:hypothetical protein
MSHFRHRRLWRGLGLLVLDAIFFSITDPVHIPSIMLIIALMLVAVNVYVGLRYLFEAAAWYGLNTPAKPRRFSGIAAAIVAGLMALQTAGSLGARDVTILLPLAAVMYFYVSYSRQSQAASG